MTQLDDQTSGDDCVSSLFHVKDNFQNHPNRPYINSSNHFQQKNKCILEIHVVDLFAWNPSFHSRISQQTRQSKLKSPKEAYPNRSANITIEMQRNATEFYKMGSKSEKKKTLICKQREMITGEKCSLSNVGRSNNQDTRPGFQGLAIDLLGRFDSHRNFSKTKTLDRTVDLCCPLKDRDGE